MRAKIAKMSPLCQPAPSSLLTLTRLDDIFQTHCMLYVVILQEQSHQ